MATRATSSPPPAGGHRDLNGPPANDIAPAPLVIASRYEIAEELGRGGMAVVYRVLDRATGRHLALKCMQAERDPDRRKATEALFEAEFRTLTQLQHPRVIQVFDYGVDQGSAYYTMELLDGGDLSRVAPLPWREACALIYEVCSSLALLHSRRLVHRDIGPRNIRRTRDGRPKLIDFGAMASMGPCSQAVGTPAFVAPEVAQRATLDGRTDLFSLGGTLYYALTGRPPYPARTFAQLHEVWSMKPAPVSAFAADVPPALDGLIQSLISLEPALRPRSAFDVMQRLAAIADLEQTEALSVSRAYLAMPTLIGRESLLGTVRRRASRADSGFGSSILIDGVAGSGRTRALDAAVLQLKTSGIIALRGDAKSTGQRSFALVQTLGAQLLEALPEVAVEAARDAEVADLLLVPKSAEADGGWQLAPLDSHTAGRAALIEALCKWFLNAVRTRTLAIVADDVDRADDASAAFLGALADRAGRRRLLLATSATANTAGDAPLAVRVLRERSRTLALPALTAAETQSMFDSVFGDVPHVPILADRIHRVAQGNPRVAMELAQHLVESGVITYAAGTWTLPAALDQAALPSGVEAAFGERIKALSPLARRLAECHALSRYAGLTHEDHARLAVAESHDVAMRALDELRERGVLSSDGERWTFAQPAFVPLLLAGLEERSRIQRHCALGELGVSAGKPELATIHHLLCGELIDTGLDRITTFLAGPAEQVDPIIRAQPPNALCELMEQALHHARQRGRSPRMCAEMLRWLMWIGGTNDESFYMRAAPAFLAIVRHDSGYDDWLALADKDIDAGARLMASFQAATERWNATPPEQRTYSPEEGLKYIVLYVAVSITTGARIFDARLIRSLAPLVEPYRMLSPIIDAMWNNAVATRQLSVDAQFFQARGRWIGVIERMTQGTPETARYFKEIRGAIVMGVGCLEAGRGFPTAQAWAEKLDDEPLQQVNSMYLRKVARLQLGDWEGAERYRKKAELLAVQASSTPLLYGSQVIEMTAHAMASDLAGLKQIAARVEELTQRYPYWAPHSWLGKGYFELLRGDPEAARIALEKGLALCAPDVQDEARSLTAWPSTAGAYVQVLVELGRTEEARRFGERALEDAERLEIHTMDDVIRALAIAETKLGDYPKACARLQGLLDRQLAMGVIGLHLGATYEARARAAIIAGDHAAVETYARMTAEQYRHGHGSPLGARYEVLMAEARRAGVGVLPALSDFEVNTIGLTELRGSEAMFAFVSSSLRTIAGSELRSQRALHLICEAFGANGGHLYLVQGKTLQWTASEGKHVAADAHFACAERCLDEAMSQDEIATEMASEAADAAPGVAVIETQDGSVQHRGVLISTRVNDQLHHAGVAVLAAVSNLPKPEAIATLNAVAKLLMEYGDTTGLAVQA